MSTPTGPPSHDRSAELPELDRPPAGCAPHAAPDPERATRRAVAGAFLGLAMLTGGPSSGTRR